MTPRVPSTNGDGKPPTDEAHGERSRDATDPEGEEADDLAPGLTPTTMWNAAYSVRIDELPNRKQPTPPTPTIEIGDPTSVLTWPFEHITPSGPRTAIFELPKRENFRGETEWEMKPFVLSFGADRQSRPVVFLDRALWGALICSEGPGANPLVKAMFAFLQCSRIDITDFWTRVGGTDDGGLNHTEGSTFLIALVESAGSSNEAAARILGWYEEDPRERCPIRALVAGRPVYSVLGRARLRQMELDPNYVHPNWDSFPPPPNQVQTPPIESPLRPPPVGVTTLPPNQVQTPPIESPLKPPPVGVTTLPPNQVQTPPIESPLKPPPVGVTDLTERTRTPDRYYRDWNELMGDLESPQKDKPDPSQNQIRKEPDRRKTIRRAVTKVFGGVNVDHIAPENLPEAGKTILAEFYLHGKTSREKDMDMDSPPSKPDSPPSKPGPKIPRGPLTLKALQENLRPPGTRGRPPKKARLE